DFHVTGVQTCALPISAGLPRRWGAGAEAKGVVAGVSESGGGLEAGDAAAEGAVPSAGDPDGGQAAVSSGQAGGVAGEAGGCGGAAAGGVAVPGAGRAARVARGGEAGACG